jgi:signal transduction histidine kinase
LAVFRAGLVVQMTVSAVGLMAASEMRLASGMMCAAAALWSVCLFVCVARRGSFAQSPYWWCVADVAVAMLGLVVTGRSLPPELLIGTWHAWAYGYVAVVAPTTAAWEQPRWRPIAISVLLASTYVLTVSPAAADNPALIVTAVVNALALVIFATAAGVCFTAVRRLGRTADQSQARAAELAARLERDKYRFYVHNATGLLAHFGLGDIPPGILPSLREQALRESNRLRADFLAPPEHDSTAPEESVTLDKVVWSSIKGFEHLPLEVRAALGRGVPLRQDEALVLETALVALLYNVQFHAGPEVTEVVVHADYSNGDWEVSVCDDGDGFDTDHTGRGFGLQKQVIESAQTKGMTVEVSSAPGEGTCVFIRGRARVSPPNPQT